MTSNDTPQLILHPKKSSAIWLLLGSTMFVAGGLWMAQEKGWIGYLCAGFFALGIPIAIIQLLPGSTYLRISEDGLSFANVFRVTTIPWNVIQNFFVVSFKNDSGMTIRKMVGFNFVPSYDRSRFRRRLNSAVANCEGCLPNNYGKSAEELAEILNQCLVQFKQTSSE